MALMYRSRLALRQISNVQRSSFLTTSRAMSSSAQPSLSTPIKLGDVELRNRNIMGSLTRNRSVPTTVPNEVNLEYYVQRGQSAGLVMTEGTLTSPQGTNWPNAPGIWNKEQTDAWKKIVDEVHRVGGKTFCQLWHVGRIANNDMPEQKHSGRPTPLADPWTVIEEFRQAALNAKAAGFDGVELHSANGYLVHQFIDSTSNRRTDDWGGSIENRCRFGLEALKALTGVFGPGRVGVKINPAGGYNDMGMPLQETIDTFTYYIKEMLQMELAYVQFVRYSPALDPTFDGEPPPPLLYT
ncbi:hypothetical protein FRB99_005591 [Tulasnella sp. 403]|nr:hypothetical protein FRB99_005591 [Tulasnella sp. 403]